MNKRITTYKDLEIPPERQKELRYFCRQYPYWKNKLEILYPSTKSQSLDGMPYSQTNNINDETSEIVIKRMELAEKIDMVEKSAKKASPEFWQYIIMSVCYQKNYGNLKASLEIPLSEAAFRDRVKMFIIILDKKKK